MRAVALALALAACGTPEAPPAEPPAAPSPPEAPAAAARAPTVIFVVLDTVRSDHTSLCGYARPTTPVLEEWKGRGASVTCAMRAPGDWTIPSHASFFTGQTVAEHGAAIAENSEVALNGYTKVRPLVGEARTLAEVFRERGYQTVAVSGNPVVRAEAGLMRGFDVHQSGPPGQLAGEGLAKAVRRHVADLDPSRPLFLFVNVFDAHDPYPEIPEGVDWVPPRESLQLSIHNEKKRKGVETSRAFLRGELGTDASAAFLAHATDGYDYGIHTADQTLGQLMGVLERRGWLEGDFRLVVTSDHGELLGEHGLLRHGGYLWEENQRVPLMVYDSTGAAPVLPEPFPGVEVFGLVADGRLPDTLRPVEAISFPNPSADLLPGEHAAAIWEGDAKLWWRAGESSRVDLAADPAESHPSPVADPGEQARLDTLVEASRQVQARPVPDAAEFMDALKAMGYVE